ncbi:type IV pilus modification protein PilV [Thalassotalea sp. LPB0316]|uniref:type IV pilus modification protein PilV n=1 Tax=Thalassotalea sp. LPB0316 TaxID=2769490 RepID=UPI00186640DC|nr:type IV pilus modification protein PilV [Thalassotalea sp. LPB0316]QOL25775.1 type IV pilus modification protein PilV [Thalassotalea sp. LPB0316]
MRHQRGISFIEVLVSLVILSTGIIGAVAMQASAKKGSFDAMQRSMASALAQDIIERMRANDSDPLNLENYQGSYGAGNLSAPDNRCDDPDTPCNSLQMVSNDLYEWEQKLIGSNVSQGSKSLGGLVGAQGCIEHNNQAVTVVVSWQGRVQTQDSADSNDTLAFGCGTASDKRRQVQISAFIF